MKIDLANTPWAPQLLPTGTFPEVLPPLAPEPEPAPRQASLTIGGLPWWTFALLGIGLFLTYKRDTRRR